MIQWLRLLMWQMQPHWVGGLLLLQSLLQSAEQQLHTRELLTLDDRTLTMPVQLHLCIVWRCKSASRLRIMIRSTAHGVGGGKADLQRCWRHCSGLQSWQWPNRHSAPRRSLSLPHSRPWSQQLHRQCRQAPGSLHGDCPGHAVSLLDSCHRVLA